MPDIQIIALLMVQQSMSYQYILEIYKLLIVLAHHFRARFRLFECLASVLAFLGYLVYINFRDFVIPNYSLGPV